MELIATPSSSASELLLHELEAAIDACNAINSERASQQQPLPLEQHADDPELLHLDPLPSGQDDEGDDAWAAIDSILSFLDVDLFAPASDLDRTAPPNANTVKQVANAIAAPTATSVVTEPSAKEASAAPRQTLRAIRPAIDAKADTLSISGLQKTKKQVNKSRKRMKDELEYLRQQVLDLEEKLAQLKPTVHSADNHTETKARSSSSSPLIGNQGNTAISTDVDTTGVIPAISSLSLWKRVAHHQLNEKQKSEHDNMVLRDLLEAQLRLAHSLENALCAWPDGSFGHSQQLSSDIAHPNTLSSAIQLQAMHYGGDDDTAEIYDILAQQLEVLTTQVDKVFVESGLGCSGKKKQEIREGRAKTDAQGLIFLEVVDANIVPFDLNTTRTAMWKMLRAASNNGENDDQMGLRAQYSIALKLRRSEAVFHAHMLGKQILEDNRAVIVCSTMSVPEGSLFGSDRIQVHEHWWTVMEELPGSETSTAGPSTIIQSVARMTHEVIGESEKEGESEDGDGGSGVPSHVSIITDLVFGSFHQNLAAMHQMLENLLLENKTT